MNRHLSNLSQDMARQEFPNTRPRDAATLMIVDTSGPEPRVLMGRRSEGHVFMPGKFVFPGGRIDPSDHRVTPAAPLAPRVRDKLLVDMRRPAGPRRAEALALAALRETFEETGILVGSCSAPCDPDAATGPWKSFLACGVAPCLDRLTLVARAITPPRRVRRYDTRFFGVDATAIALKAAPRDAELLDPHWLTQAETERLDLPRITRVILEELMDRVRAEGAIRPLDRIPCYDMRNGVFRRRLI